MLEPWNIVPQIAATSSSLEKKKLLSEQLKQNNSDLFEGLYEAYNPYTTFGVKSIPDWVKSPVQSELSWCEFKAALDKLKLRQVTGNAARDLVRSLMLSSTYDQWTYWYKPILEKDIRAGFGLKTINQVVKKHPEYTIPVFSCQLADNITLNANRVCGKKILDAKMDGVRTLSVVYPSGDVRQYSRNGREFENFPHIRYQLSLLAKQLTKPMVFDGETISTSFQNLMKQVFRKSNVTTDDVCYQLFDMIPLTDFMAGEYKVPQLQRREDLQSLFNDDVTTLISLAGNGVTILPYEVVDLDTHDGRLRYEALFNEVISQNFEGLMIKDLNGHYQCKRTHNWLKRKPCIRVTLPLVDLEEGTGRNKGRLGAFVFDGVDEQYQIRVNVGTGISDEDRVTYWDRSLIGLLGEIEADAITLAQDGTYSLRFPRFVAFRGQVPGEKI